MEKISHPKKKNSAHTLQMLNFWFVAKLKNIGVSFYMGV
jgi:hypothetical protein